MSERLAHCQPLGQWMSVYPVWIPVIINYIIIVLLMLSFLFSLLITLLLVYTYAYFLVFLLITLLLVYICLVSSLLVEDLKYILSSEYMSLQEQCSAICLVFTILSSNNIKQWSQLRLTICISNLQVFNIVLLC